MKSIHEYWWGEMYGRKYGCWRRVDLAGVLQGSQIKEALRLWVKSLWSCMSNLSVLPLRMRRDRSFYGWVVLLWNVQKLGCDQNEIICTAREREQEPRLLTPICSGETAQQPILIDWWFHRRTHIKQVDSDNTASLPWRHKCQTVEREEGGQRKAEEGGATSEIKIQ